MLYYIVFCYVIFDVYIMYYTFIKIINMIIKVTYYLVKCIIYWKNIL